MRRSGAKHEVPPAVRAHFQAVLGRARKILGRLTVGLAVVGGLMALFMVAFGSGSAAAAMAVVVALPLLLVWIALSVYYTTRLTWIALKDYLRWKRGDPPPEWREAVEHGWTSEAKPPTPRSPLEALRHRKRAALRYLVTGGIPWIPLVGQEGSRNGLGVVFYLKLTGAIVSITVVIALLIRLNRRIHALEDHQTRSLPTIPTEKPRHSTDQ